MGIAFLLYCLLGWTFTGGSEGQKENEGVQVHIHKKINIYLES